MPRTLKCTPATRSGRRAKAEQFNEAAATVRTLADEDSDVADAYVTLLVHGIAASDVICCARLGEHAMGENHAEAVQLLATAVDKKLAGALETLLGVKTKAGYSERPVSSTDLVKAERATERLIQAMRELAT
ncbi:hypothetical protein [Nocardioides sp.]|uniref:hypothetical protein n=1 Tax=Nocardioides sp. TaxID=35761 RepID=UPI00378527AC